MATVTFAEAGSTSTTIGSRFRRALKRMTAARETRAPRRVDDYLFLLDDPRLATFSMSRKTTSSGFNGNFPW